MTVKCFNPINRSKSSSYMISISDTEIEKLEFYANSFSFPSIDIPLIFKEHIQYKLNYAGGEIIYSNISMNVLNEEGFEVWDSLHDLSRHGFNPSNGLLENNKWFILNFYLLDNKGNPIKRYEFYNCRVNHVDGFNFNSSDITQVFSVNIVFSHMIKHDIGETFL